MIACVYSNQSRSEVRDLIDVTARWLGWTVPDWYTDPEDTGDAAAGLGNRCGRRDRYGHWCHASRGVGRFPLRTSPVRGVVGPARSGGASRVRLRAIEAIRRAMGPYQPIVVFLTGLCAHERLSW